MICFNIIYTNDKIKRMRHEKLFTCTLHVTIYINYNVDADFITTERMNILLKAIIPTNQIAVEILIF